MHKHGKRLALWLASILLVCVFTPAASALSALGTETCMIRLDTRGGYLVNSLSVVYAQKEPIFGQVYNIKTTLPEPKMDGYIFSGWYDDMAGGEKITSDYNFTGDTTIYAHWDVDPKAGTSEGLSTAGTIAVVAGIAVLIAVTFVVMQST